MEVIKTGKLHAYIGPDNYIYTRSSCRRTVTYYSCRKKDCLGRANVRDGQFRTTEPHDHPVDLEQVKRFRFRHRLQTRAAEETLSIAEIYKQEAIAIGGMPGLKLKSVNRGMYRARHGELPPPPKSINELATMLVTDKWKDKLLYSYGEDKEEFFKACLQSEDSSTQIIFMSPTFEDFARTGAPLRLHMDSAFKIKPACGEGSEYVALHMYIGTILYPFVHMFTSLKSYYAYFSLMKYISDFIPNLNVEIFVSNDQESIEAAYTVFPKAVKSYYQPREKEKDNNHKKETDLSDVELFNKDFTRRLWPKPGVWRFMETLKDIDYVKLCDFYKLRNKRIPNRYPKRLTENSVQTDPMVPSKIKVNSEAQTLPPTNIKKYFSEFKPFISLAPNKSKSRAGRRYLSSSTHNFNQKRQPIVIQKSVLKKKKSVSAKEPIVIKKLTKSRLDEEALKRFYTQGTQDENILITTINSKSGESMELEVLLDSNDIQSSEDSKKPIILRRKLNTKVSSTSDLETTATEALDILQSVQNDTSSHRKSVVINPKLLNNAKIVRIEKMDSPQPIMKNKRKDMQLIERQLAEMEGTLEPVEDDYVEYVEVPRRKAGRKRKAGRRKGSYNLKKKPKKAVEVVDEGAIETLDENLLLNSDDGEIETLDFTDDEEYKNQSQHEVVLVEANPKEEEFEEPKEEGLVLSVEQLKEEGLVLSAEELKEEQLVLSLEESNKDECHEDECKEEITTEIHEVVMHGDEPIGESNTVEDLEDPKKEEIVYESYEEHYTEELTHEMLEEPGHEEVIDNNTLISGENVSMHILYTEESDSLPILTDDHNQST